MVFKMKYEFESEESLREFISQNVLTGSEAAEYLDITRATFSSLIKRGMLTPLKDAGGTRLFMKSDLKERKETARPGRPVK